MRFSEAIRADAGENLWIEVELVARASHNPGLAEDIRIPATVPSNRSHSLNSHALTLSDGHDWVRTLDQMEKWLVFDVLGALPAMRIAINRQGRQA